MLRTLTILMFLFITSVFLNAQAATLAGTRITNQAEASYMHQETGRVEHVFSNVASLVVAAQIAFELAHDQTQAANAGQIVYLPYTLTNTGNQTDRYYLTLTNSTGDNGDLDNFKIYLDENGDGQLNPGETEISQTAGLTPNERINLLVAVTLPTHAAVGHQYVLDLQAQSIQQNSIKQTVKAILTINEQAVLTLTRRSDRDCQIPLDLNSRLYQEVTFKNTGHSLPTERTVLVNGVALQGILLEDTIPAYFKLLKDPSFFVLPSQGLLLVSTGLGEWIEYDQWDGNSYITRLGVLLPSSQWQPNNDGRFGYTLMVQKLPDEALTLNLQTEWDKNGDGNPDSSSNVSCQTLPAAEPIIKDRTDHTLQGTVFDSQSLQGVAGAKLQLMRLSNHTQVAETFSDVQGKYGFADLQTADYYLIITPPAVYQFPSIYPPEQFTTYTVAHPSYGLTGYQLENQQNKSAQDGIISYILTTDGHLIDIPLDPKAVVGQIALQKQASLTEAKLGEMVLYTLKARNLSGQELYSIHLKDQLPRGLKYIRGTAKLNNTLITDPQYTALEQGTLLDFHLGNNFPLEQDYTLTYLAQVTALAQVGSLVNTAQLHTTTLSGTPVLSAHSSAAITVKQSGVLSDRAILFGRLAVENGCKIGTEVHQQHGYPLAGIRLYMEDGTYVITDEQGQYSLYGLTPGVHVLKIDPHTVPEGLQFMIRDQAQAGAPDSRFVDLLPGDYYRADFTAACPSEQTRKVTQCTEAPKVTPKPLQNAKLETTVQQCESKTETKIATEQVTRTINNAVQPIHFDSGKATIPPEYIEKLKTLLQLTKDKQNVRFKLIGHTDNQALKPNTQAQFKTNLGLSEARAQEVAEYVLKQLHIESQISVAGKGEQEPIASNASAEGMAKNRRVELVLLYDETIQKTVTVPATEPTCTLRPALNSELPTEQTEPSNEVTQATPEPVCTTQTITEPSPVITRLLARQKTQSLGWGSEVERIDPANVDNLKNLARFADKNGDISNGLIEAHQQQVKQLQSQVAQEQSVQEQQAAEPSVPEPKEAVKSITNAQAKQGTWLWPLGDTSLDGRFMVVVRSGVSPSLVVNGTKVSSSQLGEQIENKRENAQLLAWYGVELKDGENTLKVTAKDGFGNERVLAEKTVKRPSSGVAIKMLVEGTLTADHGRSTIPVRIQILDNNDYPAKGNYFVTLETNEGSWVEPDIQDKVAGHQVKITNGERIVHLRSSSQVGQVRLRATTGQLQSETDLAQVAELRPLVAVGLLDLRAHKGFARYESLGLRQSNDSDDIEVSGRAALFMKGRIRGDLHLTLAYDSEKDEDAELLRDINPNEYYRVYGDASLRGYDAQSRSALYARLEKDRHSLMWGDYITDNGATGADIARTSRTLTGLNGIYDDGKTSVQLFAARPDQLRGFEEIAGNGTAMFYQLQGVPLVRNSEVITLVTRDKDNAGLIIKRETLTRFRDYSIDEVTGYITFHRTIPSVDENNQPMAVQISYDREEKGENYLVAGVRLLYRLDEQWSVGASYTHDAHATEGYDIAGIYTQYQTPTTQVQIGLAQMQHADGSEDGQAYRLQASHTWENKGRTELTAVQADPGYTNNGSGTIADRRELKVTHQQPIGENVELKAELAHSESLSTEQERQAAELSVSTRVDEWRIKGGMRHIRESDVGKEESVNTALVGVERNIDVFGRKGNIKAEYEREIGDTDRQRTSVGAELQITDQTRAYVRYDQADRLGSGTLAGAVDTQDSLVAGVRSQVSSSTEVYSEYRLQNDMSGEDVVAVSGAKSSIDLAEKLTLTPSIEVMDYLEDSDKSDAIAASIGISDTRDDDAKKLLRLETRRSDTEHLYGLKGTYARKLSDSTTLLVQDELRYQRFSDERDSQLDNDLTIATAHRPQGNGDYNALYAYKWNTRDSDQTNTHILSTHQHYRVNDDWDISGRLGAKRQRIEQEGLDEYSNVVLADARALWDLNEKVSLDIHGGVLTSSSSERQYALGAGFAYNIIKNVRIGAGYNFNGFTDKDLDPDGQYVQGSYVGLQVKADEALFGWLEGEQDPCKTRYMVEREQQANAEAEQATATDTCRAQANALDHNNNKKR